MAVERTLVLIKPDAVQRSSPARSSRASRRVGSRSATRGSSRSTASWPSATTPSTREKPFFGELVEFITSAPTLALALEGESAISVVRTTMGATNPAESAPGTIRGDLALAMPDNLVHGSDSPESAQRELALWFG